MSTASVCTVTIAIPVYNSASTLEACLRSASAQTLDDIEILVADDGSTDDSAAIVARMAEADPRIRLLRLERNGGKPRAMNLLLQHASGRWFAVLDADDVYHPDRMTQLVAAGEARDVDMVADNLEYYDAGVSQVLRTGFDPVLGVRVLGTRDLLEQTSSFADFDLGLLKPVIRRSFIDRHELVYHDTRLAEDFYYLLEYFVAGGRCCLLPDALYRWTLPFGTLSRRWTTTGSGAWRYDYRQALRANQHYVELMRKRGHADVVALLQARGRQYGVMIHYLDAQRAAAAGRRLKAAWVIASHPSTYRLLVTRIAGRLLRALPRLTPGAAR